MTVHMNDMAMHAVTTNGRQVNASQRRYGRPSGVDLVRKVGGRGMVGASASWRSVTKFIYRRCHNFENGVRSEIFLGFYPKL